MAALPHTRVLVSYLLTTFKRRPSTSAATSPLTRSVQTLSLEAQLEPPPRSDASTDDDEDSVIASSSVGSTGELSDEDKTDLVLEVLASEDDEDKPERLKVLLAGLLHSSDYPLHLDPIILGLLHRHREDLAPSGLPVPPLPSAGGPHTPTRPSVSRSSSFRRNMPLSLSSVRGAPHSGNVSSTGSALSSPTHSPWSSPRVTAQTLSTNNHLAALNAGALEFKFSAGASEFRPGSAGFGTPLRPRSPITAHQAQATWAFTSSPLGTPKYTGSPASSVHSASYFPHAGLDVAGRGNIIPRLPWAEPGDDGVSSNGEYPEDDEPYYEEGAEGTNYVVQGGARWDPFESDEGGGGGEEYYENTTPSYEHPPNQAAGLGGMGNYLMTPFDVLHSVFAGSDVSAAILEEALIMTSWDVDQAIEYIVETVVPGIGNAPPAGNTFGPPGLRPIGLSPMNPASAPSSPLPQNRMLGGSGSRPLVVSRDSYDSYTGGNGGRGASNYGAGNRWQPQQQGSRPGTPNSASGDSGRGAGVGGRVCRYYLSGACLRSDCHFSHDVGKAVCKFWLRGHCLKGEKGGGGGSRCDFLHSIPPVMRADFEERARKRSALALAGQPETEFDGGREDGPDLDFPSLGEAPRARRLQAGNTRIATRFSAAVKSTPAPLVRPQPIQMPPRQDQMVSQPRQSVRIILRPPELMPTLPTGAALASLYAKYRASFLELGANRNKCLARAAESWRRGDGAGARKWSRDAQDFNRQVAIEGADAARRIVEERAKTLKEAIAHNEGRGGSTDDVPDRATRGKTVGDGVCLGVVSPAIIQQGHQLSAQERTEVALDLHGLHGDEALTFAASFLQTLERDRFLGLAYIVVGQARHTGASDVDRGAAAGRLRLEASVSEFLSSANYAHRLWSGVICVDALR